MTVASCLSRIMAYPTYLAISIQCVCGAPIVVWIRMVDAIACRVPETQHLSPSMCADCSWCVEKRTVGYPYLTNVQLLHRWGDTLDMREKMVARRLEWLGNVMRIEDEQLPTWLLFSFFERTRPAWGPKKRWRDCMVGDHRARGLGDSWVDIATTSRADWRQVIENVPQRIQRDRVSCVQCGRDFARPGDFKRHKCREERGRPVEQQRGACRCGGCHRWFRSRGGLAVHRCTPDPEPVVELAASPVTSSSRHHHRCVPVTKSAGQTAKHSGPTTKRPTVAERATFTLWCVCGRRFRRRQDLAGHSSSCKSSSSAAP